MAFPPIPVYPRKLDTDYTLFVVNNTTESRLCQDNSAWASEVNILAVSAGEAEVWPSNGFATVSGEMFYYDSVGLNSDGKVCKLLDCARNLSGSHTQFNRRGTPVRGFVVAEHHNQIVGAILNIENFVGYNFTNDVTTLDWRIRHLQALPIVQDDYQCPDINFTFDIVQDDPQTGIIANYDIEVDPPGALTNFRIDFGDGQFTTTLLAGTHNYAVTAIVDPVVTISNDQCQIITTPSIRVNPTQPPEPVNNAFDFPVPEIPPFPDFTFVPCTVPAPQINLPTLALPCVSIEGQIGPIPSVIIGPNISLVSQVTFTGIDNPINITQSTVTFVNTPNIPSMVYFDVPPTIVIEPPIPPTIVVIASTTTASALMMQLDWTSMPDLKIDWGQKPEMNVNLQFAKQVRMQAAGEHFGGEFSDIFDPHDHVQVEYEPMGIPSEIKIMAPTIPAIKIDATDIPRTIKVDASEINFPREIVVNASSIPKMIELVGKGGKAIPEIIEIVGKEIPSSIDLILKGQTIPDKIYVELSSPIPDRIIVDSEITVKGFPEYLEVKGIPDFIELLPPKTMPPVEMVYNGAPIEVKITMDKLLQPAVDGRANCVMIVPCV